MATTYTSTTLSGIYKDDYSEADNFHQILFKSGRALQARELTQLQTLMYKEMGRFGNNIFKEGAAVSAGGTSVNSSYEYVKIAATNQGGNFADIPVGAIFEDTNGVRAQVQKVEPLDTTFALDTLYVSYIAAGNTSGDALSTSPKRFGDNSALSQVNGSYELVTHTPRAVGRGVRFDVGEGDFFVMGRFVHATAQSKILSPYTETYTGTLGYKVVQEVITVDDDASLYDNSGDSLNTASPGADRYRIRLELIDEADLEASDTFVFLCRIENSTIVEKVQETDAYDKINDMIALRTKEESGNYIVNPFVVNLDVQDSDLTLTISEGSAYVNGYRVENPTVTKLSLPKPSETETITNDVVPVQFGNYFISTNARNLTDLTYGSVQLYDAATAGGANIGTARIRAIEEDGAQWKVYVFDVNVTTTGKSVRDVLSIGTGSTNFIDVSGELYETTNNDLLMPTSRPRTESFSDITMIVQRSVTDTAVGGAIDISAELGAGESFVDQALWVISGTTTNYVTGASITGGAISGLPADESYDILYYVTRTSTQRSKTLTTSTVTAAKETLNGSAFFDLGVPDIFEVDSVRLTNSLGIDITNVVSLDDGQRDNYYANGRLILDSGAGLDVANAYAKFKHFTRGAGDFYTSQSYSGIEYKNIPTHTLNDGEEVSLWNYVDFRPDFDGTTFSNLMPLPRTGTSINADIAYYLPRADKVLVTQEGDFQVLMGQQSSNPQYKKTPDGSLELYKILLNANTLDNDDMQVTPIEHKRYTMADIAELENKLDGHIEFTQLSILELEQKLSLALDSSGNERIESGSQVDDFSDQTGADTQSPDYSASLDPESKLIRPKADEDNIRLIIDNTLTTAGVVKKGDNVYLKHTDATWIDQNLASRTVNLNPFGNIDNVGTLKLSPSSDEWKESVADAARAVDGSSKLDQKQAFLWNNWTWNWSGRTVEDQEFNNISRKPYQVRKRQFLRLREKYQSTYSQDGPRYGNGRFVNRVISSDTLRSHVGNRIVDLALIPWVRSRKIFFHAKGLKPNTKFTPFFDGTKVDNWVKEEPAFVSWSDRTDDLGNQKTYSSLTGHPGGSTELISDANGEIIGSFFIPNLAPQYYVQRVRGRGRRFNRIRKAGFRFRAGVREFKLLDITENNWAQSDSKCFAYYSVFGALWNQWKNVMTTRRLDAANPLSLNNPRFPGVYNPRELQNSLDAISAAAVGNAYVDPQTAGKYGPSTVPLGLAALNGFDVDGTMSQVLSDYVSVNKQQFAGSSVNTLSVPQNPMAQTFYVDNQFGLTLTKIDLFFAAKPTTSNLPVSIHIRPVENGAPSPNDIIPDSHVTVNAGSVTATPSNTTLSLIQAAPTTFTFEEPIFLSPWTEYAVVITTASTEYELFSAKTQENVFGQSQKIASTQRVGNLYLPQNGLAWVGTKDQDLMMKLTRASFDTTGGSLILKNANLSARQLDNNPIRTTNLSSTIYVSHPCHGLEVGDNAFIDSCEAVGGISIANLEGSRAVTAVDLHGYQVVAGASATSDAVGGGEKVLSRRNKAFRVVHPYVETIVPNYTSTDVSAKFTSGKYVSGTNTRFVQDARYGRITPKQNLDFEKPRAIYNFEAETNDLGGDASVYVKIDMKSASDYVSPVVDLQRASLHLITECIDDPTVTPHIYPVDETQPYGGSTGCKHITTPVTLEQDAVGIETKIDVSLGEGCNVDYYYRTCGADQNIADESWIYQTPENRVAPTNDQSFNELRFLPGGQGGQLSAFNQVQSKFVITGKDAGNVSLKDMRVRYLGV